MRKTILSIGQCSFDQNAIASRIKLINSAYQIISCDSISEALSLLGQQKIDLIMINRVFDKTGEEGTELLKLLKTAPETAQMPCLLVSNFADAQESARLLGALPGFGKAQLHEKRTAELLTRYLSE